MKPTPSPAPRPGPATADVFSRFYRVYGLTLKSAFPLKSLALLERARPPAGGSGVIELSRGPEPLPRASGPLPEPGPEPWFKRSVLPDGSEFLRWKGLFEFLISAKGEKILCRRLERGSPEVFENYLLGQVLSFAMAKRGMEPLHATAVVAGGGAAAFLGDCGRGKSSLGAAFLGAGWPVATDDLLVLGESGGNYLAHPGAPRIKLFPRSAKALLGDAARGVPMNPLTRKAVIPLGRGQFFGEPAPLRAIYVLLPRTSRRRIRIRPLPRRASFLKLLEHTYNPVASGRSRLAGQFAAYAKLSASVPVKTLSYPRGLGKLPRVREAVLADMSS